MIEGYLMSIESLGGVPFMALLLMYLFAVSTGMRETGIRPDIVERIIGHHVESGIAGGYSSYTTCI